MPLSTDQLQTYGLWIQSGAIVVSGLGVALTIWWNVRIARRRATLDILLQEQSSETLIRERTGFVKLRDAGHMAQWAEPTKASSTDAEIVRATLNRYELVALGIRKGTMNGEIYKRWCRTTLVADWIACKPLVIQIRSQDRTPTYFVEFEALARRWAVGDERPHVRSKRTR